MAGQFGSPDPQTWGLFEWLTGALLTAVTAISGFVWGTRTTLADHGRRIDALELESPADIRRLETKIDAHHSTIMSTLLEIAKGRHN